MVVACTITVLNNQLEYQVQVWELESVDLEGFPKEWFTALSSNVAT